jgi:hypothetical protein
MSCSLEFFSTEVSAAPPKVIAHVPPNELYVPVLGKSTAELPVRKSIKMFPKTVLDILGYTEYTISKCKLLIKMF